MGTSKSDWNISIVDSVSIPIIATGGINDIRGVRAAFAPSTEGVYVGTRFIASEECPASHLMKEDIIRSIAKDLVFVSSTQRSTPHKFARELGDMYKNEISTEEIKESILLQAIEEGFVT
jgi:NAD(P)H-dependent flavin oxidoreductase YrpB (nitropropane dioxygenase family)